MIVIGIDPGTANTGFGVVRTSGERMVALDGGVIETDAGETVERRLAKLHDSLGELIRWHEPKAMALEDLFFGKNVASALSVGEARGVALLAAAKNALPCFDYTPQAVKKAVCGSGAAEKDQVQRMVASLLGLPEPRPPTTRPTPSRWRSATPAPPGPATPSPSSGSLGSAPRPRSRRASAWLGKGIRAAAQNP